MNRVKSQSRLDQVRTSICNPALSWSAKLKLIMKLTENSQTAQFLKQMFRDVVVPEISRLKENADTRNIEISNYSSHCFKGNSDLQ